MGSYSVEIETSDIAQRVGADIGLDVAVQIQTSHPQVNVQSEAARLISPDSSSTQTTVDKDLVQSLPLAVSGGIRNSADLLKLTPGYS